MVDIVTLTPLPRSDWYWDATLTKNVLLVPLHFYILQHNTLMPSHLTNIGRPGESYFVHFSSFQPDEDASLAEEFDRLAICQNWATFSKTYRREKQRCFAQEFSRYFGRDTNNLAGWQDLCQEVGINRQESITQCKKVRDTPSNRCSQDDYFWQDITGLVQDCCQYCWSHRPSSHWIIIEAFCLESSIEKILDRYRQDFQQKESETRWISKGVSDRNILDNILEY